MSICRLDTVRLKAEGGKFYQWSTGSRQQSIVVNPTTTTTYRVTVTSSTGSKSTSDVVVFVNITTVNAGTDKSVCKDQSVTLTASTSANSTVKWNTNQTDFSITVTPSTMKLYTVTASNGTCIAIDNVVVNVKSIKVNAGYDRTICKNNSVSLYSVTIPATKSTFKWSSGATTSNTIVTPVVLTKYQVTATSTFGCTAIDEVAITVINCKNNDNLRSSSILTNNNVNLNIYPNPGNGIYSIEGNIISNKDLNVKILNILGVKVYESNIKSTSGIFNNKLNITSLPDGLYLLVVESQDQKIIRNLVKN